MPIISITIPKGGSGKTTTSINLAAALHELGKKVLLVDADPQVNLSQSLGIHDEPSLNLYTELLKVKKGDKGNLQAAIIQTRSGIPLIPSSIQLAAIEPKLVSVYEREQLFSWLLKPLNDQYDFIFIDCPSSMNMLTINALVASRYVLMPLQAEFLPLQGVKRLLNELPGIKEIKNEIEPDKILHREIDVIGLVFTRYDNYKKMNQQIREELETEYKEKIFQSHIRSNIQLANAQRAGLDIFSFDKRANGAIDYMSLAKEFLKKTEMFNQ
ncbi:MAG: ParA family protein [Ferruginibacter sp.]